MRVQPIAATVPAWMRAMLCVAWLLLGTTAIAQPAAQSQAVSADWRFRLLPATPSSRRTRKPPDGRRPRCRARSTPICSPTG